MAVKTADAILARFPGPVILRVNRLKMLALLAGSLAFVVCGILLIVFVNDDAEAVAAGMACVLFFGACAIAGAVMLLPGAGSLTLDARRLGGLQSLPPKSHRVAAGQPLYRRCAVASGRQQEAHGRL